MNEPHDDLGELLAPKPADDVGLRESLFTQTARQVTWNRRMRRVRSIAAVLVIFAGGTFAGVALRPAHEPEHRPVPLVLTVEVITVPIPVPVPQPPDPSGPIAKSPEPVTAKDAELRAELADDRTEAARFYRTAGDRYLNDVSDYANAARCYRLFLNRAGADGLNPEPGDTWLLTSLKNAAFKEKAHDSKSGG